MKTHKPFNNSHPMQGAAVFYFGRVCWITGMTADRTTQVSFWTERGIAFTYVNLTLPDTNCHHVHVFPQSERQRGKQARVFANMERIYSWRQVRPARNGRIRRRYMMWRDIFYKLLEKKRKETEHDPAVLKSNEVGNGAWNEWMAKAV